MLVLLLAGLHASAKRNADQRISLLLKNVTLDRAFEAIEKKTDFVFFYDVTILKGTKLVSVDAKDESLRKVLDLILMGQDLSYSINDKTIFIKKGVKGLQAESLEPGLGHDPKDSLGAAIKMTGVVYNESGQPLSGANVTVEETGRGTVTNAKGEFNLSNIPSNSTLLISYIGYTRENIKVKNEGNLQVYLKVATNQLDKAVVQAYGTTTEKLNTGNITTVTAEQIERQPVMNPLEALYGKVPGLIITQTSGYASAPISVQIRGMANINGIPSDPLFVIDGVPLELNPGGLGLIQEMNGYNVFAGPAQGQSPLFSMNPLDIESITVLKDADATAIYGSRGANGVVLITTKRGSVGRTKLGLNFYQGLSAVTQHYDMMNTHQYLAMRWEALKNDGIAPNPGTDYDLLSWDTTRNVDLQNFLWGGIGKTTDAQATISGGDKLSTFRIAADYHRQTSILNYSGADQRGSIQFNLNHRSVNQRLNLDFTSYYSYAQSNLISLPANVAMAPDAPPVFDKNGNLNYIGWEPIDWLYPYGNLREPYSSKTSFLNSQLKFQYELIRGLNFLTSAGYSTTHVSQFQIDPISAQDPNNNPTGSSSFGNTNYSQVIVEPDLEYKRSIAKGKLDFLLGGSYQSNSFDGVNVYGNGYVEDNLLYSISNAPSKNAYDGSSQYKYSATFSRLNYNWENKYILNLSARRDGSSRFGPGKQFGNFGAVGVAWIFTEENWLKDHFPALSFGKLRSSYGLTGSDLIGNYGYLTRWTATNIPPYQQGPAYVPTQLANPDLHWQTNRKLEAAIDLGFLKDRILFELAWYRNRIGDQLLGYILPGITGFTSVTSNFPAVVQNSGLESTLDLKVINKKNIGLDVHFEIGANRNLLLAFPNIQNTGYASFLKVGKPLTITPVLHYTGVDPLTGYYTFQDRNKDGQIDPYTDAATDCYLKDLSIKFDGGFSTELRYKGLQLDLFFSFREQPLPSALIFGFPGQANINQPTIALDRWQKPGDVAKYAKFTSNPSNSSYAYFTSSDGVYSDGSYIRLRNVAVSYSLPDGWIKRSGIQDCKIFMRIQNVFVLTRYNGLDPDVSGFGGMPPAKIFTSGIQLNL